MKKKDSMLASALTEAKKPLDTIEYIVTKRVSNLDYLKRVQDGNMFWMNTVRITPDDMQWFFLGVSIAPLLQIESGWPFLRGCSQLMEEYEYHFSNVAVQGMKILKALTVSAPNDEDNKMVKPVINKIGGNVVYEFLRTPNIPCELDYSQVVFSLCDVLTLVYRKLMDESNASVSLVESIIKVDGRFKHHFFGQISRDMNALASYMIKARLARLDQMCTPFEMDGVDFKDTNDAWHNVMGDE